MVLSSMNVHQPDSRPLARPDGTALPQRIETVFEGERFVAEITVASSHSASAFYRICSDSQPGSASIYFTDSTALPRPFAQLQDEDGTLVVCLPAQGSRGFLVPPEVVVEMASQVDPQQPYRVGVDFDRALLRFRQSLLSLGRIVAIHGTLDVDAVPRDVVSWLIEEKELAFGASDELGSRFTEDQLVFAVKLFNRKLDILSIVETVAAVTS